MVYAGDKGEKRFTLGVSGRLKDRNLVMWDQETGSLWSQILGVGLHGKAKGVELDMLPAIFVSMSTWKRMHPKTKVLNMSLVRQRSWFYTSKDLARGTVRGRQGPLTLAAAFAGISALAAGACWWFDRYRPADNKLAAQAIEERRQHAGPGPGGFAVPAA